MIPTAKCVSCLELPVGGLSGGNPVPGLSVFSKLLSCSAIGFHDDLRCWHRPNPIDPSPSPASHYGIELNLLVSTRSLLLRLLRIQRSECPIASRNTKRRDAPPPTRRLVPPPVNLRGPTRSPLSVPMNARAVALPARIFQADDSRGILRSSEVRA